jgi:1,2-phenylacetyl-CoA epoxidase PaaB subunit
VARIESERSFEVFARHAKDANIAHIGQVQADTQRDALVFAFTLYDERKWEDMFVVPEADIVRLVRPE